MTYFWTHPNLAHALETYRQRTQQTPRFQVNPPEMDDDPEELFYFELETIQEWMDEQDTDSFFFTAKNLTWRNLYGENAVITNDAHEFLNALVGLKCHYSLKMYEVNNPDNPRHLLTGTVYHHDSPTGETRDVYAATEEQLQLLD